MARAQGARAQMALAWETTYGKAPTKDFIKVPFVSSALGAEQPLLASDVLGYGRAPQPPVQDAITVRSGLQTIDAQAKIAHSFRTTTESIQVLARAAELSGNSMQTLQTGFRTLTVGLSQFAQDGTGPAAKAIKALHLNATELLHMPLDKRIAVVTDAIRKYGDTTKQAALFSQLFGYRGFEAFMRLDTKTLRQARKDVNDFGVGVSDLDASQVERTNDAITRLAQVWKGLSNSLTTLVAPALEKVADWAATIARSMRSGGTLGTAIRWLVEAFAGFAVLMTGRVVVSIAKTTAAVFGLTKALFSLRAIAIRSFIGIAAVAVGELAYRFNLLGSGAEKVGGAFHSLNGTLGGLQGAMGDNLLTADQMVKKYGDLADEMGRVKNEMIELQNLDDMKKLNDSKQALTALGSCHIPNDCMAAS